MQIRALMYFDELVRTNSMRQAAENLNVAPTAISRQIENLEYHFGAPLVERSARGVKLTAAGELLAARAGRTLRELDHVQQLIGDLKGLQRGRVSIYANGATVANLLAPALAEFSLKYPKLRFQVAITSARQAVEAVNSAEADIAVTLFAPAMSGAKVRLRSEIAYDLIAAPNHPAAGRQDISLRELAEYSLALPEQSFGFRQAFDALFEKEGLELDPVFITSSLEMLKELVLSGAAVTLLPALTVNREIQAGQLVAIPLSGKSRVRTHVDLCVAPDRQLSFAATKLLDFIERFMRERTDRRSDLKE
ncbi:LysR family transcriptional regulator [Neorhizobium sp. P12A]|jgi:DNA-binding transcriptional LysR family regulator|uniref:LysR family transcriptional regulator n=1 Tax=Rhizobium/Agrobacterium group TaxID=227290 RepID=UPI001048B4EB|nr:MULTISPECIES: LysR family transcriptional regulator [Rhizobium/Agrobacterium group]KAA0699161.1 LysR family transcriptional regulator [Neorhizobium sp. P12A]TCR90690.1 LysR family transcriptional regulator [Rhizobium sp. BK376]